MGLKFESDKDILDFMVKYDKIAPEGNIKRANIIQFAKIGLNRERFKIHLSLDRYYFLTQVSDDVEYYKAYLRINEKDSLEFYRTINYKSDQFITFFENQRVKINNSAISNFYQAKSLLREERLALL